MRTDALPGRLKARPIMLEPVVNIEITVQDEHMGDITGDLSSKRGQVSGTNSIGGGTVTIAGQVPLSELSGYQTRLNSVTGGHGSYTMATPSGEVFQARIAPFTLAVPHALN